jgi:protein-S-isoprenylcysteine O-methyltransferase Ste14
MGETMASMLKMLTTSVLGLAVFAALLFVPAGTFAFWQAWMVLAVTVVSAWIMSIYFLRTDPSVLQRRQVTPESRGLQKALIGIAFACWGAMVAVSSLDHRFGWSAVPPAVCVFGAVLLAVGFNTVTLVLKQNSHAAFTIRVEDDQPLVSSGLYGMVRHPMYTCNAFITVGTPLALGSYWGLVLALPILLVFTVRIHDEEELLKNELDGYLDYMQRVPHRLVPGVW